MNRRLLTALVVVPTAGAAAGFVTLLAGLRVLDAVAAAVCVAVGCSGVLLAAGETVRWPSPAGPERTSAGWHDVRLLAETLSSAGSDSALRRHVTARISAALPLDPARPSPAEESDRRSGVTRRQYEAALAQLRRTGRP